MDIDDIRHSKRRNVIETILFFIVTYGVCWGVGILNYCNRFMSGCSRSKFLSKIFKINVKNFREIFPDFTHRKRGSDFITVPFLSSGSHALRLPSAFPFSVPCLEYTLSVLQQSNLTPHISGLYALPSN